MKSWYVDSEKSTDGEVKKLQVLLRRENIELPVITIDRIIARNGLIHEQDRNKPALQRFERQTPNELWQVDFKGPMGRGSAKCEPLTMLDDHSRFVLGAIPVLTKQTAEVMTKFKQIFNKYGVPDSIMVDHGVPWWNSSNSHGLTKFSVWLMKQDLKLIFSGVRHPQTQGKIERFHKSLNRAVWNKGAPSMFSQWDRLLKKVVHEYNFIRPHQALSMKVPAECYVKSKKSFNHNPKPFDYGDSKLVYKVDSHGMISLRGKRLFACQALAGEYVKLDELENKILVAYRNSLIREIDFSSSKTIPL